MIGSTHYDTISEIRRRINENKNVDRFSTRDVQRLNTETWWIDAFLQAQDQPDVDVTTAVIVECLKWRTQYGVEKIGMLELKSILERNLMYFRGTDNDGASLLWVNFCHHTASDKTAEKLLVYWLERHVMETRNASITLVLNYQDAGSQNMDFDFMKFLLQCFRYYYPSCLREILFYGVPAKLSASWRAVRGYMDARTLSNTISVTAETIRELIPSRFLPRYIGGEDDFTFKMEELARCIESRVLHSQVVAEKPPPAPTPAFGSVLSDPPVQKRSVTFNDDPTLPGRPAPLTFGSQNMNDINGHATSTTALGQTNSQFKADVLDVSKNDSSNRSRKSSTSSNQGPGRRSASVALRGICKRRMQKEPNNAQIGGFMTVSPRENLALTKIEGEDDPVDCVAITNTSDIPLMYKIKTTSPEKFRVRPSVGIVKPGITDYIKVVLQKEYRNSIKHERFLVLAVRTGELNTSDFSKIFDGSLLPNKFETRLNCTLDNAAQFSDSETPSNGSKAKTGGSSDNEKQLLQQIQRLNLQQNLTTALLVALVIIQVISFFYLMNRINRVTPTGAQGRFDGEL